MGAFNILPQGDASSAPDDATVYIWLAALPPASFTFCLRLGHENLGTDAVQTAPRLWRHDVMHYRVDVGWAHIQVALMTLMDRGIAELDVSLVVLQWHGPVPAKAPSQPMQKATTRR